MFRTRRGNPAPSRPVRPCRVEEGSTGTRAGGFTMYLVQDCLHGYSTFESFHSRLAALHALRAIKASNAGDFRLVYDDGKCWQVIA